MDMYHLCVFGDDDPLSFAQSTRIQCVVDKFCIFLQLMSIRFHEELLQQKSHVLWKCSDETKLPLVRIR